VRTTVVLGIGTCRPLTSYVSTRTITRPTCRTKADAEVSAHPEARGTRAAQVHRMIERHSAFPHDMPLKATNEQI
jgi:hypothetical protein